MKKLILLTLCSAALLPVARAQNVLVTNDADHPVPVEIAGGVTIEGGGDASAANQTAVQANAGSDATKAIAVQGVTSGKAIPVSMSAVPTGAATAAKQPALGTAGTASTDVITVQGIASGTAQPVNGTVTANAGTGFAAAVGLGTANAANSQVATSGTAGTLAIARATRRFCTIRNLDTSISVYVGAATVSASNGMLIKAGESMNFYGVGLIQVIAASGTPTVAIYDYYD